LTLPITHGGDSLLFSLGDNRANGLTTSTEVGLITDKRSHGVRWWVSAQNRDRSAVSAGAV